MVNKKSQKRTNNQFVRNIEHLKELIKQKHNDYALVLAGGKLGIFSRKTIDYIPKIKKFRIINHIDDSKTFLTEKELLDERHTLIGKAIPLKSLICIIK